METQFKKLRSRWMRVFARFRRKKSMELDSSTLERIQGRKQLRQAYRKSRVNPVRVCYECGAPVVPDHYLMSSEPVILCQVCRLLRTGDPDKSVPFDDDDDDD